MNLRRSRKPGSVLCDYQGEIYPPCKCVFFEKEVTLSGYANKIESPWFFSGKSDTITFFVYNEDIQDITIHLENSPDAIRNVRDAQTICIKPGQTANIAPYKFSKFIRLVANSGQKKINCKVWFQTQLKRK